MKNKWISYLDMDKVTVDYNQGILDLLDLSMTQEIRDGIKQGKSINDIVGIPFEVFWDKALKKGKDHWTDMPLLPWTKDLYSSLKEMGDVAFLTSTGRQSNPAAQGKQEWVKKHFDTYNIIITHNKFLCAKGNSILIDDNLLNNQSEDESNTYLFECYGGNSFLFPNYMKIIDNEIKYEDVKKQILDKIKRIKKENNYA